MLKDEDRIYRNLYGQHDWRLAGARAAIGRGSRRSLAVAGTRWSRK
jgi:NADH-quinone oxidoreductase subunit F